jgi:hypothetical protein
MTGTDLAVSVPKGKKRQKIVPQGKCAGVEQMQDWWAAPTWCV